MSKIYAKRQTKNCMRLPDNLIQFFPSFWNPVALRRFASIFPQSYLANLAKTILLCNPATPLRGSRGPSQQHVMSSNHASKWVIFPVFSSLIWRFCPRQWALSIASLSPSSSGNVYEEKNIEKQYSAIKSLPWGYVL